MGIEALLSTQIIDTTAVGRAVMTAADAAAARTAIDAASTSHTHAASDITSGIIETARLATGTADSTTYLRGDQTWATVAAAGVGGSTGAVDNAVLRADGTGGSTVQSSSIVIADNYTGSPNNSVNHASIQATGGTTNVSVSIVPKGSGAFCLAVPDGTATGGNARGANAIDLQTSRTAATQVASGSPSVAIGTGNTSSQAGNVAVGQNNSALGDIGCVAIGVGNSASGRRGCVAIGSSCSSSGQNQNITIGQSCSASGSEAAIAVGRACTASSDSTVAIGNECTASSDFTVAIGNRCAASAGAARAFGLLATANRYGQQSHASGAFAVAGDAQSVAFTLRNKTTDGTTAVTLFGDQSSARLTIPSGKILFATVQILGSKSDGSAVAVYLRQVAIKNVGGTTSLVGTVNTIGTDTAAGTSIAITADDTNDALQIAVTGVASETWRWVAVVYGVELAYGA